MRGDIGGDVQLASLRAPAKRSTKVVELDLHPVDGVAPARPVPVLVTKRRALPEVRGVPIAHSRQPTRRRQLLFGELPDGLEHAVSRASSGVVDDDERLADQGVEPFEHVDLVGVFDDRCDGGQVEPTGEDRCVAQQLTLVVGQQIVGPAHRQLQRLLPLRLALRSAQQSEAIAESIPHLDGTHGGHPSRCQLDTEREPVECLADLRHCRGALRVVQAETDACRAGSLDEQLDRVRGDATIERKRRNRQQRLTGNPQVFTRRRQNLGVPGPTEDLSDGRASGVEHMLAVVDHQQEPSAGNGLGDGVDQFDVSLRRDAQVRSQWRRVPTKGHRPERARPARHRRGTHLPSRRRPRGQVVSCQRPRRHSR